MKLKLVVGGALFKSNKLLLTKRSRRESLLPSYWEIPGGKCEANESLEQAIKREFLEEVGMKVMPHKIYHGWLENRKTDTLIEIDFIVKSSSKNVSPNKKEIDDYKWVTKNESKKFNMTKGMRKSVNLAFETLGV